MARTDNLNNFLTDVANSLRSKTETTEKISASNFDKIIDGIETGSEPILQEKIIKPTTSTKNITPDNGYDALSRVTILGVTNEIDDNIQEINIRKGVSILGVEGTLEEGTQPSGTLDIIANGTYDVKDYASANVQVGESVVTKGIIVNQHNDYGYATNISIVGLETIPDNYIGGDASSLRRTYISKYIEIVNITGTNKIGRYALQYCPNLVNVSMEGVTIIGDGAFTNDTKLALTILPSTLVTIGNYAFQSCTKLAITEIPGGVTSMGSSSFQDCDALISLRIPRGVIKFPSNVFRGCDKLSELYIEGDITSIATNSFLYCYALSKVVFYNITSVPTVNILAESDVFKNGEGVIYVPTNMIDAFKNDTNYGQYADRIKDVTELE